MFNASNFSKLVDKSVIAKLSMTKVGGKASRLMGSSTKLNKFLAGNFTIPLNIRESAKWAKAQTFGCANKEDISTLVNEAMRKSVKSELEETTTMYAAMQLTKEQEKLLPQAIVKYEEYLNEYFKGLQVVKKALDAFEEKQPKKKEEIKEAVEQA